MQTDRTGTPTSNLCYTLHLDLISLKSLRLQVATCNGARDVAAVPYTPEGLLLDSTIVQPCKQHAPPSPLCSTASSVLSALPQDNTAAWTEALQIVSREGGTRGVVAACELSDGHPIILPSSLVWTNTRVIESGVVPSAVLAEAPEEDFLVLWLMFTRAQAVRGELKVSFFTCSYSIWLCVYSLLHHPLDTLSIASQPSKMECACRSPLWRPG